MTKRPKISVLIPAYNVEAYISQCIESVILQTYNNLEIIIIDDGSTDRTGQIADDYSHSDSRIKVIHKENAGYGCAMNDGLRCATGEYIGIVESDDYIALNMYEELAEAAYQSDADVVKGANYEISNGVCNQIRLFEGIPCNERICPKEHTELFFVRCHIWSAIYKKEFLLGNDIRFHETPGAAFQDTSFAFKVWTSAETVYLIEKPYVYYRIDNMGSSVNSDKNLMCIYGEADEIDRYLDSKALKDSPLFGEIRNAYRFYLYLWNFLRTQDDRKYLLWGKMAEVCKDISERRPDSSFWPDDLWSNYLAFNAVLTLPSFSCLRELVEDMVDSAIESFLLPPVNHGVNNIIKEADRIMIYGAGDYGRRVYGGLKEAGLDKKIEGFVVSGEMKEKSFMELPVKSMENYALPKKNVLVIVAVSVKAQPEIIWNLAKEGYINIIRLDKDWRKKIIDNWDKWSQQGD